MGEGLTPAGLAVSVCLGFLLIALPRRHALIPLLAAGMYVPMGQAIVLGGLHFYIFRLLILIALVRIVVRREGAGFAANSVDRVWLGWLLVSSFLYVILDGRYVSTPGRFGSFFDAAGIYTIVRIFIRDRTDALGIVSWLAILLIPLGPLFAFERVTGRNLFAVLGGVPAFSEMRNGHVRCQGAFRHAILAGSFGATTIPLLIGLGWAASKHKLVAALGAASAFTIAATSGSSGAASAVLVGGTGFLFWPLRSHMRWVRIGMVTVVIALALMMKAPVWFIIDRFSELIGGDGWYRSALIDSAVNHLGEWWLIGTGYTRHWMATGIPGDPFSADIVNEFVNQGIRGGLIALLGFLWLLVKCFGAVGREVDRLGADPRARFAWSVGCALVAHVAALFSVTYYDQISIYWYLVVAFAAVLQSPSVTVGRVSVGKTALAPKQWRLAPRPSATVADGIGGYRGKQILMLGKVEPRNVVGQRRTPWRGDTGVQIR